ncbi:target of EGR1 1 [Brachionus plicatilis]|uniref:Target of EGR1 1 n=1 Tax=Brachionus plicatilis TaxID=10195 RepID=A0A3M7S1J6_BRAPC|nr:target of EGR1 1 [Brachionus plicatilis]
MNESSTRNVDVEQIPLIELNSDNIHQEWDNLTNSLKDCTFISLDLEMSGLGKREELNDQSIDERYKNIRKAASSYSIFSFGISCFKICSFESDNRVIVKNKSFDLALLCSDHFMVDPESIQFLIFNKHDIALNFTKGIKYYRGNDRYQDQNYRQYPRELFSLISNAKKPIVLHNGLIDLIFMYQNFYANAPENLMKFLADLSELFQSGIYDTKFISEFYGRYNSTYLEYLYYKS